jgi:hypothetical protein
MTLVMGFRDLSSDDYDLPEMSTRGMEANYASLLTGHLDELAAEDRPASLVQLAAAAMAWMDDWVSQGIPSVGMVQVGDDWKVLSSGGGGVRAVAAARPAARRTASPKHPAPTAPSAPAAQVTLEVRDYRSPEQRSGLRSRAEAAALRELQAGSERRLEEERTARLRARRQEGSKQQWVGALAGTLADPLAAGDGSVRSGAGGGETDRGHFMAHTPAGGKVRDFIARTSPSERKYLLHRRDQVFKFKVTVHQMTGQVTAVEVLRTDTGKTLKASLHATLGVPANQQAIFLGPAEAGACLSDHQMLFQQHVQPGSVLFLMPALGDTSAPVVVENISFGQHIDLPISQELHLRMQAKFRGGGDEAAAVKFVGCTFGVSLEAMAYILVEACPRLRSLSFSRCVFSTLVGEFGLPCRTAEELGYFPGGTMQHPELTSNVTCLELTDLRQGPSLGLGLQPALEWGSILRGSALRQLVLHKSALKSADVLVMVEHCPSLEMLKIGLKQSTGNIADFALDPEWMTALGQHCPSINWLDVQLRPVPDAALAAAAGAMPNLAHLNLTCNDGGGELTDESCRSLAKFKHLRFICLQGRHNVTDTGLCTLLGGCVLLSHLNLGGTSVKFGSAAAEGLSKLGFLRVLDITQHELRIKTTIDGVWAAIRACGLLETITLAKEQILPRFKADQFSRLHQQLTKGHPDLAMRITNVNAGTLSTRPALVKFFAL